MESRQMMAKNKIGLLEEGMKQNLDHLLLIEKLLNAQDSSRLFGFKSWWTSPTMERNHANTRSESDAAKAQLLSKQQQQQQQQKTENSTTKEYLDEISRQLSRSTDQIKQLEEEIQRHKNNYSKLEQSYSKQRSIYLEKQIDSQNKHDQLEKLVADLKTKHQQQLEIKERLENQLDDVLLQCDLKVKGYQQNMKEMQAVIDHNEELERFNSASHLNNEKYHELEEEIERLQVENNDYRNRLDQIEQQQRLSEKSDQGMESKSDGEYVEENSWSDNNEPDKECNSSKNASFNDGEAYRFLDEQNQEASRQDGASMIDSHVLRTDFDHAIALKNDELDIFSTKNSELEVELKQAMETIDFLRRQHQDDRETIKKLSDNNMIYLDQIKSLSEENKNLTFQQ